MRRARALGDMVVHAPQTLRALVRADELWLVALAAGVGVIAGLAVVTMAETAQVTHQVFFRLGRSVELSASPSLDWRLALGVPCLGGLGLGLFGLVTGRLVPRRVVDPVEANALYGGRMSLLDSLVVVAQTLVSNGVGASVGLEAGYAQMGSAVASRLGRSFRVRRADLRVLVGCGAAGAIGAAFNAPLTGAFYAYELIIGTYSIATLAPVAMAAICATGTMRILLGNVGGFEVRVPTAIEAVDYVPILALGMICALGGIALMRGVTEVENLFRRSRLPTWLRPMLGGLIVGALALISPIVLSSGHSALRADLEAPFSIPQIALLIGLKSLASAVSIGSGFRGGLFFASLLLGALVGKLFAGRARGGDGRSGAARGGVRAGGHEQLRDGGRGRAADDGVLSTREHWLAADDGGGARGGGGLVRHGAADVRLLVRDLAVPPARRGDPQRRGCRLGAEPHGGAHDAARVPARPDGPDALPVPA